MLTMPPPLIYGNWIRVRVLLIVGALTLACAVLTALPLPTWMRVVCGLATLGCAVALAIPLYAYWAFSPAGGDVQARVYDTLIDALAAPAGVSLLDIGAGNGVLSTKLALAVHGARVTGVDSWGPAWECAQEVNARRAGVADRVTFCQASAAALPFEDATFTAVVSNLTFHEVDDEPDKRRVVAEALRVLQPGGRFAFIDLFHDGRCYGDAQDFERAMQALGLAECKLVALKERLPLPRLLWHRKVLGNAALLWGTK